MQHLHQEFIALAQALGADASLCIRVDAGTVHLEQRTGSKGALMGARLRVETTQPIAPYAILLRAEGSIDRAGKQLAINRELQLGDPAFDQQIYIETRARPAEVTITASNERVDVDAEHTFGVSFDSTPRAVEATIRDGALGSPHLVSLAVRGARAR